MKPSVQAQPWPAELECDRAIRAFDYLRSRGLLSATQQRKVWEALVRWAEDNGEELGPKLEALNREDSARAMGTRPMDLLRKAARSLVGRP